MFVAQLGTVCAPEPCATDWFGPAVNDGTSLTAFTVMETVTVFESTRPSFALYVNCTGSGEKKLAGGEYVNEPLVFSVSVPVAGPDTRLADSVLPLISVSLTR